MSNKFVELTEDSRYLICSDGYVVSRCRSKPRILRISFNPNGYAYSEIYNSLGKKIKVYLHKAVAHYFLTKSAKDQCVNHKDLDKSNNRVDNLEWCTTQYNTQHSWDNGASTGNSKSITKFSLSGEELETYQTIEMAAHSNGIKPMTLYQSLSKNYKQCGGFKWQKNS